MTELATRDLAWARKITERLRLQATNYQEAREKVMTTLQEAQEGGAADLLGYASWTAYVSDVLGDAPLRLERDQRQELVAELAAQGMSTRAIAPIVGVSQMQVVRDVQASPETNVSPPHEPEPWADFTPFTDEEVAAILAEESDASGLVQTDVKFEEVPPRAITGLDGKTYKAPESRPKAEAITSRFSSAITDLNRVLDRFHRLSEEDAFRRNAESIRTLHRADITRAISELQHLADSL